MANTGGFPKCVDCGEPIRVVNGRDKTRCKSCIAPAPTAEKVRGGDAPASSTSTAARAAPTAPTSTRSKSPRPARKR